MTIRTVRGRGGGGIGGVQSVANSAAYGVLLETL